MSFSDKNGGGGYDRGPRRCKPVGHHLGARANGGERRFQHGGNVTGSGEMSIQAQGAVKKGSNPLENVDANCMGWVDDRLSLKIWETIMG